MEKASLGSTIASRFLSFILATGIMLVPSGCADGSPAPTATHAGTVSTVTSAPSAAPRPITRRSIRPSPLISRGKPIAASRDVSKANANAVVDGQYCAYPAWRTDTFPTWLAIRVGEGPSRLLLSWNNGYTYNYVDDSSVPTYGIPANYTIEVSTDSTNGADGQWRAVTEVRDNRARTRAHSFPFAGASWVRMTVTGIIPGTAGSSLAIDEIDIHDASAEIEDAIFFAGDSITAAAFNRCDRKGLPSYPALVHEQFPEYFPALINGGVGGVNSAYGARTIPDWLAAHRDYRLWAIGYGTNDAWQAVPPSAFEIQIQVIIDAVITAGGRPVLARIPYALQGPKDENVQSLNEVIDRLTDRNQLLPGPDLYAWFRDHPDELSADGVHPSEKGSASINRLWHEALLPLYQARTPSLYSLSER